MSFEKGWITGFVDGEGCFYVGVNPHPEMSAGYQVLPEFTVVQHKRDEELLEGLRSFFGCGVVRTNHGDRLAYRVRGKADLLERIIPFFEDHPLQSKKRHDFERFREVLLLMQQNAHLTGAGIEKIRELTSQMNRGAHDR